MSITSKCFFRQTYSVLPGAACTGPASTGWFSMCCNDKKWFWCGLGCRCLGNSGKASFLYPLSVFHGKSCHLCRHLDPKLHRNAGNWRGRNLSHNADEKAYGTSGHADYTSLYYYRNFHFLIIGSLYFCKTGAVGRQAIVTSNIIYSKLCYGEKKSCAPYLHGTHDFLILFAQRRHI